VGGRGYRRRVASVDAGLPSWRWGTLPLVSVWRSVGVAAIAVWCVAIVVLSLVPIHAEASLIVARGKPAKTATVSCGPVWGSGYVHAPAAVKAVISGNPCSSRRDEKVMTVVDVGLVAGGLVAFAGIWRRRNALEAAL
jgi:hypothetical protein